MMMWLYCNVIGNISVVCGKDDSAWVKKCVMVDLNTLTAAAILGPTRLPLSNPKFCTSCRMRTSPYNNSMIVFFSFTRWQHECFMLEAWQAALLITC